MIGSCGKKIRMGDAEIAIQNVKAALTGRANLRGDRIALVA